MGNFIAGAEMQAEVSAGRSIVLDRYYASTIAYILGTSIFYGLNLCLFINIYTYIYIYLHIFIDICVYVNNIYICNSI